MGRKKKPPAPLTEADWQRVFKFRCWSKSGGAVTDESAALCRRAFDADPERYRKMDKDVFGATKPFGA